MICHKRKNLLLALVGIISVILTLFLSFQKGMVPVKAAEEEIGRTSVNAYGGTFGEFITMEMIGYDNNRDIGTYRFRYYIYHSGESYTYQVAAVGLFLDDVHKATFDEKVGKNFSFSNDTRLYGTRDLEIPAGAVHRIKLRDLAGGGLTEVSIDKDVYIPYPNYTITYKDYDGSVLKSQSVPKYSSVNAPSNPSRIGYTFIGWDDTSSDVRGNKTITAQYSINYYDVRYLDYNGSVLKTQSVAYTGSSTPPTSPTRIGYTFDGWSSDGSNIIGNRDIIASYRINYYTASFISMGGSSISSQFIQYQSKVMRPSLPQRNNYKFMGWYTDLTYRTLYDFDTLMGASNLTLYAKWDAFPVINTPEKLIIYDHQYTQEKWDKLKLKDISASDIEDGNLTNDITITKETVDLTTAGDYVINYQIRDSVGSIVNKEMPVKVIFNNPPQIDCKDYQWYEDEVTTEKWKNEFLMKHVSATDIEDGNMADEIEVISDNVDLTRPGDYQVVYGVTDAFNKTTKVTAKIKIKYNFAPSINASNKRFYEGTYSNDDWAKKHVMDNVTASDVEDGDITNKIKIIENDVDMAIPAFYHVKYQVTDAYGKKDTKTIQVEIVYNHPAIIKADNKSFYEDEFTEETLLEELKENVTAFDSEDGDISKNVEIIKNNVKPNVAGSYEVTYKVVDSGGKETMKTIDVTIKNNHEPKLEIFADNKRFVEKQYTEQQWIENIRLKDVTATDIEDHDITNKIKVIEDDVNPNLHGVYKVIYQVTDQYGKTTKKTIKVTVEENLPPVIHASERWFNINETITDKVLLKNVIAYDDLDGEISKKVSIKSSTIKEHTIGNYTVTYCVKDSLGVSTILDVPIHIKDSSELPEIPVDPPTPPTDKDAVIFANGRKYGTVKLSKFLEASELQNPEYESVVFGIFAMEDIKWHDNVVLYKDSLVDIIYLDDKNGTGTVYQEGHYYVKEIAVDDQYVMGDTKYNFEFKY